MFATALKIVAGAAAVFGILSASSAEVTSNESAQKTLPSEQAEQLFVLKVLPLFKQKCFGCHGNDPDDLKGDFDLRSRDAMLRGGESEETAVIPGNPEGSPLYQAIRWESLEMPPKENDRLSETQIDDVRRWILAGAPWPKEDKQQQIQSEEWASESSENGIRVHTSEAQSEEWANRRYDPADLWAYQTILRYPIPWDELPAGAPQHPIDAFLSRRLNEAGLTSAKPADKRTQIRRVTFGLTGLPPTPEEIENYTKDDSPDAFDRVVKRLLSSEHYGEQMARHWLDVVRYADTAGFSNDFSRPNAWRYRDYVVRSFNSDKPYDRFIKEQLAGDELDLNDPENLIAVGYLRMGPWEHTSMSVAAVTRQQWLDDVTHSVGVTFLATAMRCFKCHDHKFDPMPTLDYYRMQAIFAPVQFADRSVAFQRVENQNGIEDGRKRIERLAKDPGIELIIPADATKQELEEASLGIAKVKNKQRQIYGRLLNQFKPLALSVYNGPPSNYVSNKPYHPMPEKLNGKLQPVFLLTAGSLESPGRQVSPGVLSALVASNADLSPTAWNTIPNSAEGRRLALANWIATPNNPLTARVIVNRVWQWHFGTGLAANPNNFGKMGSKPSHPELLDWLAQYFVEHDWSIKALHRLILSSQVYKRSSEHKDAEKIAQLDPDNRLLSTFPPRRLTAEELRDSMLAVSGELNRKLGGLPIRPEINDDIAMQPRHVMGSVAPAYQASRTPQERNRRSIYALKIRTLRDPFFEVFDQPNADNSCERRDTSTVTPQVFSLFNGKSTHHRALSMASRIAQASNDNKQRIQLAFRLAYGRLPNPDELIRTQQFLDEMSTYHQQHLPEKRQIPTSVVREMVEEMTGLAFQWDEPLDIYQNYVPDLQMSDVDAKTRALAELCLVLFNSNEFVYVY